MTAEGLLHILTRLHPQAMRNFTEPCMKGSPLAASAVHIQHYICHELQGAWQLKNIVATK